MRLLLTGVVCTELFGLVKIQMVVKEAFLPGSAKMARNLQINGSVWNIHHQR
jgi:hypothetical protein